MQQCTTRRVMLPVCSQLQQPCNGRVPSKHDHSFKCSTSLLQVARTFCDASSRSDCADCSRLTTAVCCCREAISSCCRSATCCCSTTSCCLRLPKESWLQRGNAQDQCLQHQYNTAYFTHGVPLRYLRPRQDASFTSIHTATAGWPQTR